MDQSAWRQKESARKKRWKQKKGRAYAEAQNEKVKEYIKTFAGKMAHKAGQINSSARARNGRGRVTMGDIIDIWAKQNKIDLNPDVYCAGCGKLTKSWSVDHIVPMREGGKNEAKNIQLLCVACHAQKTQTDIARMWEKQIFRKKQQKMVSDVSQSACKETQLEMGNGYGLENRKLRVLPRRGLLGL